MPRGVRSIDVTGVDFGCEEVLKTQGFSGFYGFNGRIIFVEKTLRGNRSTLFFKRVVAVI